MKSFYLFVNESVRTADFAHAWTKSYNVGIGLGGVEVAVVETSFTLRVIHAGNCVINGMQHKYVTRGNQ